jgi:hypothetical protein
MTTGKPTLDITPETRVGALLDTYPDLDKELFDLSPAFKKLKNSVLRKTVAKVTTLRQAARVGNVSLATVINTLRTAAGQSKLSFDDEVEESSTGAAPDWFDQSAIKKSLDARPIIESGERPMDGVLAALEPLGEGEVLELITPFVPAPLIDIGKHKGFEVWHQEEEPELVITYFGKPKQSSVISHRSPVRSRRL